MYDLSLEEAAFLLSWQDQNTLINCTLNDEQFVVSSKWKKQGPSVCQTQNQILADTCANENYYNLSVHSLHKIPCE